ncbi:MAG: hypothetical protein ABSB15_18960 [Bryobacteraceae bacterium]
MKLGAEPKKIAMLGGLLAVALLLFYFNSGSSDDSSPAPRTTAVAVPPPAIRAKAPTVERHRSANNDSLVKDWKPRLGFQNPEDRPDPATVDPTLRLELLAKVQSVEAGSPGRNLFDFGQAPPPPPAQIAIPKGVPQIAVNRPAGPVQPPPPPGPPRPPEAPAMTFKYYGYKVSASDGHKAAFLLDGDDILIAGENDTVKRRYRVVKIGVSSITIEDTQFKSTQTLPLQEMAG